MKNTTARELTEADYAAKLAAEVAEMDAMAPVGMEWCDWSGRYVRAGMAVGCN